MTFEKARRVEHLRCGPRMHSLRALSEVICDEFPDEDKELRGNQLHGKDLCWDAMVLLGGHADIREVPEDVRDRWDV